MSQYVYNEHDQNQVKEILKKRKMKRRKKRRRRLLLVVVVLFIMGFFISDFSKIQSIVITGNQRVTQDEILEQIPVKVHSSISLFVSTKAVEEAMEKIPSIKQATVSKDLLGNVEILMEETKPVAYQVVDTKIWLLDEKGNMTIDEAQEVLEYVQMCPKLIGFDENRAREFAKEYHKIPLQVQNQISDIRYSPQPFDETRNEFLMDDGKILYLRTEDMAKQLASDRYETVLRDFPDAKYYSFEGKNCYTW